MHCTANTTENIDFVLSSSVTNVGRSIQIDNDVEILLLQINILCILCKIPLFVHSTFVQ